MKFLIVNDPHLSDVPPRNRTETYVEDIRAKLEESFEIAKQKRVSHVIITGDVFHNKAANRVSYRLTQNVMRLFDDCDFSVIIAVGNHDISNGRLDSVERQPIGVFHNMRSGIRCVEENYIVAVCDEFEHCWSTKFDVVPGVAEVMGDGILEYMNKDWKGDYLIAHMPIAMPHETPIWPHISSREDIFQRWKCVIYGHIHEYHGFYKVGGTWFLNLGAISRGSIKESDLTRKPKVAYLELGDGEPEVEEIELTCAKPASEVFKLIELAEKAESDENVAMFLTSLKETMMDFVDVNSLIKVIENSDMESEVKSEAVGILETV